MKAKILSFAIALFVFTAAFAARVHFVGTPCLNTDTGLITGKVAGLGQNADGLTITITGKYGCDNPNDKRPPGWNNLRIENIPLFSDGAGNYTFNTNIYSAISRDCPNAKWEMKFDLTAMVEGTNVSKHISTDCN
jgi:hypothetical protein